MSEVRRTTPRVAGRAHDTCAPVGPANGRTPARPSAALRMRSTPAWVAARWTARPSVGCGCRSASPAATRPSTMRVMVGPATPSTRASAPLVRGPAKTSIDNAESRAGVNTEPRSTSRSPRRRWIEPEFSARAVVPLGRRSGWSSSATARATSSGSRVATLRREADLAGTAARWSYYQSALPAAVPGTDDPGMAAYAGEQPADEEIPMAQSRSSTAGKSRWSLRQHQHQLPARPAAQVLIGTTPRWLVTLRVARTAADRGSRCRHFVSLPPGRERSRGSLQAACFVIGSLHPSRTPDNSLAWMRCLQRGRHRLSSSPSSSRTHTWGTRNRRLATVEVAL